MVEFERVKLKKDCKVVKTDERNGTLIEFTPDQELFGQDFKFQAEFIEDLLWKYAFLNRGLTLTFNGKPFKSEHGLKDLLEKNLSGDILYPIIHVEGEDIEIAFTHGSHYGEEYYSFVNGQHTTMGGTHQQAFREAVVEVLRNFYKKDFDAADVRQSIVAAVSLRVVEPVFESQTKTKLWSADMAPGGPPIRQFIGTFVQQALDAWLQRNREAADALKRKLEDNERERKELAGIRSLPANAPKKHRSTTASCAIAGSTLVIGPSGPRRARSSLSKAIPPPARSPLVAMCRRRRFSPSRANRSTRMACPRR